jgi:DNA-binding NarL/FixJ family response regulator
MRVLCVARHPFLSEHLGRFFEGLGVDTMPCVGLRDAVDLAPRYDVDAVICDYDLLASASLDAWATDPSLARRPVIAVSLTRHPGEAHLADADCIAGFLYLPTLEAEDARRMLAAARRRRATLTPPNVLPWPASTTLSPLT